MTMTPVEKLMRALAEAAASEIPLEIDVGAYALRTLENWRGTAETFLESIVPDVAKAIQNGRVYLPVANEEVARRALGLKLKGGE